MMPVAKMLDPVIGLDFHVVLTPAGTPLLVPHPTIGVLFDPFDLIPKLGASVFVNGLPRAQAGTMALMLPHFPLGGTFVKPPTNQAEVFMGSKTVSADGEALSYLGLPALSCQCIGLPPIPRPKLKKPKTSLGLMLPVTVVLAIPSGVFVEGPPTISLLSLAFAAASPLVGKVAKRAKGSRPWKALSNRAHRVADKLCDRLRLGDVARNRVHRGVCTVTGHPVDVATGKLFTDFADLALPGPLPLELERVWYSTSAYEGPFGHGWHHSYDAALFVTPALSILRTPDGRAVAFPPLEPGESHFDRAERLTLIRQESPAPNAPDARRAVGAPADYRVEDAAGRAWGYGALPRRAVSGAPASDEPERHALLWVEDRAGHRHVLRYDEAGRLRELEDAVGRVVRLLLDDRGRIVALEVPHPGVPGQSFRAAEYAYDERGNLASMTDALGHAFRYAYAGHLLVRETDRAGYHFYFQWQGEGEAARCVRTWGDGGVLGRQLTYEPNVTRVVDSLGHTTVYEHDGARAVRTIDPRGAVTSARYEHGQVVESTDALGRATRFKYDERGNLLTETRPDGTTVRAVYDEHDQEVEIVDPLGGHWRFERNERGQLVARTNPLGETTRFHYSGGLLRAVEDAAGQATRLEYDAHANLVELASPDGTSLRWQYDALGMPVLSRDATGNIERLTYDLLGRLRRETSADGVRELEYDEQGRLTRLSDREHDVRFSYRGMGVLAERSEGGTSVRFEYDTEEDLIGVVNEHGLAYRLVRDAAGFVVSEAAYDGVTYRYEYDLAGRLARIVYASGSTSELRYDEGDRPVLLTHSDGEVLRFAYRADGGMVAAENRHASLTFELDALGRVIEERQGEDWLRHEYDALGRRVRLTSSRGIDQRIGRDALGRVLELKATTGGSSAETEPREYATQFVRDARGNELARSLPGRSESRLGRDRSGRALRHEVLSTRGIVTDRTHVWDAAGRLSRLIDRVHGVTDFTHDPLGRLVSAQRGSERFELRLPDAVGNLFRRADRGDRRYGASGQLLEALLADGSVVSHAYDAEGRLREKRRQGGETWRYAWSTESYLTEVVRPDGSRVRFDYDPFGRRIAKHSGDRTTRFLWDGDVPLHEWVEGAPEAAVTWLFEPESFTPVAKLGVVTQESIVCDDLGTPILLLDAGGQPSWSAEHTIYGELRATPSERQRMPFRFPGQYEDSETGLFYNRFRYYDPESGQYTSPDPLGLIGGTAPYAYVPDPLAWVDPLGLRYWGRAGRTFSRRITFTPTTGRTYVVFQRGDVDWNQVRTRGDRRFIGRTNIEAARAGLAPQLPNGHLVTLHHAEQDARGPWFEFSQQFHNIRTARQPPLHPYRGRQHPLSPIGRGPGSLREDFQSRETPEYWRFRAADIDAGGGP